MKRPSFQFYPADWRTDSALQSCSLAARGLWHEMLCLMHECEPYGHLAVNGKPMKPAQVARLVGISEREYQKLLAELMDAGVPSLSQEGCIYSRRMVRDEHIRNVRAEAGKKGGNPNLLGNLVKQKVNQTSNQTPNQTGNQEAKQADKQSPTPSSSSSSSKITPLIPPSGEVGWSLPNWVPADLWRQFEEMRRRKKKPLTDAARKLAVNRLERLRSQGHDVRDLLNESILHCWDTFYPPKEQPSAPASQPVWGTAI